MTPASALELLGSLWAFPVREVLVLVVGAAAAGLLARRARTAPESAALAGASGHGLLLGAGAAQVFWLLHLQAFLSYGPVTTGEVVLCAAALLVASVGASTAGLLVVAAPGRGAAGAALVCCTAAAAVVVGSTGLLDAGPARPWTAAALAALPMLLLTARSAGRAGRRPGADPARDRLERSSAFAVVAVLTTTVLTVVLTAGPGGRFLDTVSGSFLCLVVALGGLRALQLRRQRSALLDDLARQVHTDDLTGLPNRRDLVERLGRDRGAARRGTVVVKVGLDSFYEFNAQFGAALGDAALQAVARALAGALPPGWTVHRTGGDQFVLRGTGGAAAGRDVAARALAAVSSLGIAGDEPLSACAGVAEAVDDGADPAAVLSDAAAALRLAKAQGDGVTRVHDAALVERSRREHLVVAALREALSRDALTVHLQPVVDVPSGATTGFELLSRWVDPQLGAVAPDEYVPLAEAAGLVHLVGASVLARGLDAFVAAGGVGRRLRVGVNASVHELRRPTYTEALRACAAERGVPLDLLTVEVTESLFLSRDDPAARTLGELRAAGVQLAIDDFGTGYSSLGYLERLPVTFVKVDRSLVVSAASSERSRALLAAVVAVCRALGLGLVAEGVEDAHQARMVADLGITHGQGWYWSRALAPDEVAAHLAAPPRQLDPADRAA
ncbi:bifunctional diguanylate cyclase/phosphodiesterase [Quadrisphaera sp. INWT6]|uniref:putative bifunctional diguanylate cyclase/phosphodiesterase n=1 Tax=Quadrisphaera sp. INWT6 TaxID=2596917 RepID=UPI0018921831|nr:bifunctional diguanylate cyclase/phosphodiesterase [Quadrisphaera sp. INWT6]MBF5080606.1 bifunctional diguanylate cyclase/phosphodiesterase [Quadrisphaera sp. INWT6]